MPVLIPAGRPTTPADFRFTGSISDFGFSPIQVPGRLGGKGVNPCVDPVWRTVLGPQGAWRGKVAGRPRRIQTGFIFVLLAPILRFVVSVLDKLPRVCVKFNPAFLARGFIRQHAVDIRRVLGNLETIAMTVRALPAFIHDALPILRPFAQSSDPTQARCVRCVRSKRKKADRPKPLSGVPAYRLMDRRV